MSFKSVRFRPLLAFPLVTGRHRPSAGRLLFLPGFSRGNFWSNVALPDYQKHNKRNCNFPVTRCPDNSANSVNGAQNLKLTSVMRIGTAAERLIIGAVGFCAHSTPYHDDCANDHKAKWQYFYNIFHDLQMTFAEAIFKIVHQNPHGPGRACAVVWPMLSVGRLPGANCPILLFLCLNTQKHCRSPIAGFGAIHPTRLTPPPKSQAIKPAKLAAGAERYPTATDFSESVSQSATIHPPCATFCRNSHNQLRGFAQVPQTLVASVKIAGEQPTWLQTGSSSAPYLSWLQGLCWRSEPQRATRPSVNPGRKNRRPSGCSTTAKTVAGSVPAC